MKTKDFFRLVIKLFGLYALILSMFALVRQTGVFLASFSYDNGYLLELIGFIFIAIALVCLFFWLTFRPDFIIEKFKIDKGFDEDHIPFEKIDPINILRIGCILIGGIIFIENVPGFLSNCFYLFRQSVQTSVEGMFETNASSSSKFNLAMNVINLIIGYLLITNYNVVSKFLLPGDDSPNQPQG
jgi:hypothetical protein